MTHTKMILYQIGNLSVCVFSFLHVEYILMMICTVSVEKIIAHGTIFVSRITHKQNRKGGESMKLQLRMQDH